MKLLSRRRRNYSDADPIHFYCDTPSPDNTLRCVDELGHLGWCINGETSWRDDAWNVDHWDNTEEAPPVESEPTMSATEWVRLESTLKPEPGPQDTPNDRAPLSAAWLRGYHRDRNRAATPPPARLTHQPEPLPVFSCGEVDCRNQAHRIDYRPQVETGKDDRRLRAEEAAAVVVLSVIVVVVLVLVANLADHSAGWEVFGKPPAAIIGTIAVVGVLWHSAQSETGASKKRVASSRRRPVRRRRRKAFTRWPVDTRGGR